MSEVLTVGRVEALDNNPPSHRPVERRIVTSRCSNNPRRFYIAGDLRKASFIHELADTLVNLGMEPTYPWWNNTAMRQGAALKDLAAMEVRGVTEADDFIGILPGRRGSASELGMAIAAHKLTRKPHRILLWTDNEEMLTKRTEELDSYNIFWHAPGVRVAVSDTPVATILFELYGREPKGLVL